MPKGIYQHGQRTKKADLKQFMEWYEEHKDDFKEVKTPHRAAVKKFEEETHITIKPQTAYKRINYPKNKNLKQTSD